MSADWSLQSPVPKLYTMIKITVTGDTLRAVSLFDVHPVHKVGNVWKAEMEFVSEDDAISHLEESLGIHYVNSEMTIDQFNELYDRISHKKCLTMEDATAAIVNRAVYAIVDESGVVETHDTLKCAQRALNEMTEDAHKIGMPDTFKIEKL